LEQIGTIIDAFSLTIMGTLQYFFLQLNQNKMTENNNNQHSQQTSNLSIQQQSTQQTSASDPDKINIEVEESKEYDVVMSDQRRPQFRYSENYVRRNYLM